MQAGCVADLCSQMSDNSTAVTPAEFMPDLQAAVITQPRGRRTSDSLAVRSCQISMPARRHSSSSTTNESGDFFCNSVGKPVQANTTAADTLAVAASDCVAGHLQPGLDPISDDAVRPDGCLQHFSCSPVDAAPPLDEPARFTTYREAGVQCALLRDDFRSKVVGRGAFAQDSVTNEHDKHLLAGKVTVATCDNAIKCCLWFETRSPTCSSSVGYRDTGQQVCS
jgi:hypothetical protein